MPNFTIIWNNKALLIGIAIAFMLCNIFAGKLKLYDFSLLAACIIPFLINHFIYTREKIILTNKDFFAILLIGILLGSFLSIPSIRFGQKLLPTILVFIYTISITRFLSKTRSLFAILFPIMLFLISSYSNAYNSWVHKIEYGNFQGMIKKPVNMPDIKFLNVKGDILDKSDFVGHYTVLDFWFIGCKDCYLKFPDLEEFYKVNRKKNVKLFAVNRPRSSDEENEAFEKIEDLGYSFPVLKSDRQSLKNLDIYVYPTIVIISPEGEIIFKGELLEAKEIVSGI